MSDVSRETRTIRAYAKVNLSLSITGRRDDGYHMMDSLVVFAALHDIVSITPSDQDSLLIHGEQAAALKDHPIDDNILMKALQLYRRFSDWDQHFTITLEKHIPVAAGIGGGSTDAAALLALLNEIAPNPLSKDRLDALGLNIGADLPVCLGQYQSPIWRMRGIGEDIEKLDRLDLTSMGMILVNPMVGVSTKDVFGLLELEKGQMISHDRSDTDPTDADLTSFLKKGNDMAGPAQTLAPEITSCLTALSDLSSARGYIHHGMSGSGATCFALFDSPDLAKDHANNLKNKLPWVWSGGIMAQD